MGCGLHNSLARAAMMHLSCEEAIRNFHGRVGEAINRNITALDWRADKTAFLKQNEAAFTRPPAFIFLPFKDDIVSLPVPMDPTNEPALFAPGALIAGNQSKRKPANRTRSGLAVTPLGDRIIPGFEVAPHTRPCHNPVVFHCFTIQEYCMSHVNTKPC